MFSSKRAPYVPVLGEKKNRRKGREAEIQYGTVPNQKSETWQRIQNVRSLNTGTAYLLVKEHDCTGSSDDTYVRSEQRGRDVYISYPSYLYVLLLQYLVPVRYGFYEAPSHARCCVVLCELVCCVGGYSKVPVRTRYGNKEPLAIRTRR